MSGTEKVSKMKFVMVSASKQQHGNKKQSLPTITMTTTGALPGSDIVKTGPLHIKRPPSKQPVKLRIKTWQKRFLVLRDESFREGTTMLEIFTSQQDWLQDPFKAEVYSIDLQSVSHVEEYRESKSFPFSFIVTRSGRAPLVFGTENEQEMKEWLVAIKLLSDKLKHLDNRDRRPSCPSFLRLGIQLGTPQGRCRSNTYSPPPSMTGSAPHLSPFHRKDADCASLSVSPPTAPRKGSTTTQNTFPVTIQPTESSKMLRVSGDCLFTITEKDLVLFDTSSDKQVLKWDVLHINKFKSETVGTGLDKITFETSPNAGASTGNFSFTTFCGSEIIDRVREVKKRQNSDVISRQLEQQMNRLKSTLAAPGLSPMDRVPSAPCLFQTPRHDSPLPPLPPRTVGRKMSTESSSSGSSSSSSSKDILEQTVNLSEKKTFFGSGYLDLIDNDDQIEVKKCPEKEISLDDFVSVLPDFDMDMEATFVQQDSSFMDDFESARTEAAIRQHKNAVPHGSIGAKSCTPPPLPPRDRCLSKTMSPPRSRSSPERQQSQTVVTHL